MEINYKILNPNAFHLLDAMNDELKRFIFLYGGSSSSKSYSVSQCVLLKTLEEGENTLVLRKVGSTIKNSIYEDFKTNAERMGIKHLFKFQQNTIRCLSNGSKIDFSGLDDPEKIKGIANYKRVVLEELSEFKELDFKQIRKRLRGKRGQQIICMFNPISENHWIKTSVFDKEALVNVSTDIDGIEGRLTKITSKRINSDKIILNPKTKEEEVHPPDMMILQSTYLDNFWVVGSPEGTYGYYDRQVVADFEKDRVNDYDYYRIYALGEWGSIRTGGEFLASFDLSKHRGMFRYVSGYPLHVSVDNNVLPYISLSIWQYFEESGVKQLRQVHEICAEDPFNTVTKASEMLRTWLDDIEYSDIVHLYGDASTRSGNTIDDEKRSFLDKLIDGLTPYRVNDQIPTSNPPVAISGEFVNAILSGGLNGLSIGIDETCKKSINDYENVKKDVNGGILKTRIKNKITMQTYEEFGHLTDTFRYVCVSVFKDEFTRFSLRRKRNTHKKEDMKYYNVEMVIKRKARIVYVIPLINEKFVLACGDIHEYVDISDVVFCNSMEKSELIAKLKLLTPDCVMFECDKSFFPMVRSVREELENVDVRGGGMVANKYNRISANEELIKNRFRFRSDYDVHLEYAAFMDNVMDYNGKDNYEAIGCLSGMCVHANRMYFSD